MTEKDLKNLTRAELLEMLILSEKENRRLRSELAASDEKYRAQLGVVEEKLRLRLSTMDEKLRNQDDLLQNYREVAEAAIRMSAVFEASKKAAEDYMATVRAKLGSTEENKADRSELVRQAAAKMVQDASKQAEAAQVLKPAASSKSAAAPKTAAATKTPASSKPQPGKK